MTAYVLTLTVSRAVGACSRPTQWVLDITQLPPDTEGRQFLCVCVDHLSGSVEAEAFPTQQAAPILAWLRKLIMWHRQYDATAPRILHTDNGAAFVCQDMQALCAEFGIVLKHGAPYHPQSQGKVERLNALFKTQVRRLLGARRKPRELSLTLGAVEDNACRAACGRRALVQRFET